MANQDIRQEITNAGLRFWQVAERFGCSDGNFSRKLRREFTDEQKTKIRAIIADLGKEGKRA